MPEKPLPFVITDRRKFTAEGESRPDADPSPDREPRNDGPPTPPAPDLQPKPADKPVKEPNPEDVNVTPQSTPETEVASSGGPAPHLASEMWDDPAQPGSEDIPPAPTPEQMEQSRIAYQTTADRLDLAVRAANPGMDHPPAMTFDQLIQSVYMQAILQLGGGTQQGQQPQVDILGARQSIDMLAILDEKTRGNLSEPEQTLLHSALFELRLAFLEITQALARSAQQRAAAGGSPMPPPPGGGPRIVR
jgi:hypothetical protein